MNARNLLASALLTALAGAAAPYDAHAQVLSSPSIGAATFAALAGISSPAVKEDEQYVLLRSGAQRSDEPGMDLVHHYGAVQLWKASGSASRAKLGGKPGAVVQQNTVDLPGGTFDPQKVSAAKDDGFDVGPQVYVVQFVGPLVDSWLDALRTTGARPIQYVNHNAYLVVANGETATQRLTALTARPFVRAISRMTPQQKLQSDFVPQLDAAGDGNLLGTIVLADSAAVEVSKRHIEALVTPYKSWFELMPGQIALQFEGDAESIRELAQFGDAIVVEQRGERTPLDEVQAQIMSAKLKVNGSGNTVPSGTGYLGWLTGLGFSAEPTDYPIVSIVDDGIGNGDTANGAGDFRLTNNGDGSTSRLTFTVSCDGGNTAAARAGVGGHGHLNATIAGGYDQNIGFPFRDPQGYLRGQGINPFLRMANFEIFNTGGAAACGADDYGMVQAQNAQGVKISSNSWGYCTGAGCALPLTTYNAAAVAYDRGARDANGAAAGSPSLITVFAAGNDGPGANTVSTPGLAKNVITVGASENVRPTDEDGNFSDLSGIGPGGANNAMDVIAFSSRGPSVGARVKPELIAPGTHVQGSASTSPDYDGSGVSSPYRPSGQVSLAASSGTSHSTPAVAGAASLVYRWLQTEYGISDPSPALLKSYFIAHPTYLTGVGITGNLPSNVQGYGMPNLGAAFDDETSRVIVDQTEVFADTGNTWQYLGSVDDPSKPLRIALSWTDAPGLAGSTNPKVNNLDLEVVVNGITYLGNRFTGAFSTTGGTADANNNYEAVFLPAGTTGPVTVTVLATAINGDGITGNADVTDQDFALVCNNCTEATTFSLTAAPAEVAVCAGAAPQFGIDVGALNGYVGNVALTQTGAPGASNIFSPDTVPAPGTSQLTLSTAGVATGDYTVTVQGTDGTDTRTKDILLSVSASTPGGFALLAPANAASGGGTSVPLSWGAASDVSSYTVEVATDPSFGVNIIWTQTLPGDETSATATGLVYGNQYWWRVTATNPCGTQAASAVFGFTTKPQPSVLLVDDSYGVGVLSRWTAPLDAILGTGKYEVLDVETEGEPTAVKLTKFNRVIWTSGGSFTLAGPSAATETLLGNRLNAGACLFISSQDYRWSRGQNSTFMTTHLGATVPEQDVEVDATNLTGLNKYLGLNFTLDYTGLFTEYPDRLALSPGGTGKQTAFQYAASNFTAISHEIATPQPYFTTWTGFALEAASAANHQATLQRFFDTCTYVGQDAPIALNDAIAVVGQGGTATTLVGGAVSVKANDIDTEDGIPGGDVTLAVGPVNGTLTLNLDGTFEYEHNGLGSSTDSFTYTVKDSADLGSNTAKVVISINASGNVPPVADAQSVSTDEDQSLPITLTASDGDADPLAYSIVAAPANGTLDDSALPNVIYTPNANYNGPDSFTFKANDGTVDSNVATVSITVDPINDAPEVDNQAFSVNEGAANGTTAGTIVYSDPDAGDDHVVTVTGGTGQSVFDVSEAGVVTVADSAALTAGASFTLDVTVTDNGSPALNDTAVITISVDNVNDAPAVNDQAFSVNEGAANGTTAGTIVYSDPDAGDDHVVAVTGGTGQSVFDVSEAGVVTVADSAALTAGASFTLDVTVTDNGSPALNDTAVITISVDNVNDAPAVNDQAFSVNEGAANGTTAGTIVYSDPDAGDDHVVTVTGGTGQSVFDVSEAGVVTVADSAALTAGASFTLDVTVTDNGSPALNDTAVITISVDNVNDAPIAASPQAFTVMATAANGAAVGTVAASDPDGDDLAFAITAGDADGAFAIDAGTGAITVASAASLTPAGTSYALTVAVTDGNGGATDVTVEIDVLGLDIFADGFED